MSANNIKLLFLGAVALFALGCNNQQPTANPSAAASGGAAAPTAEVAAIYLAMDGKSDDMGSMHTSVKTDGASSFQPGKKGQAFAVAGPGNFMTVTLDKKYDISKGATLSLWFNSEGWVNPDKNATVQYLASVGGMGLAVDKSGAVWAKLNSSETSMLLDSDPKAAPPHQWTHAAYVYDPTKKTVRLYVNGKLAKEQTDVKVAPSHDDGEPLIIGAIDAKGGLPFKGMIDEVKVYLRPLSDADVAKEAAP